MSRAQRSMKHSAMMRCRPGTVPVCGGPGSAMHRSTSLRAAPHPGHAIASDALVASFTFQTAFLVPAARYLRPGFATLASLTPKRGVGGAPRNVRVRAKHPLGLHMTRQARRLRGALRPITRDARLSALHRGGFGRWGRASVSGMTRIRAASSSQPGRSAWRAGSCASRGERLRAAAAGRHASLRIQDRL